MGIKHEDRSAFVRQRIEQFMQQDGFIGRDAVLQAYFDEMFNRSMHITPQTLAAYQQEYSPEECQAFFDESYPTGW